ncbi:MAG: NAD(P)-dependent oxidoreductase [Deltaproteobacteria bacterium]|nr:NAD(P)-dependent oxidoreductase [Deltaproteobacteria bacterium]MBW2033866.1 NAD(P)-dependent oxidoreductase [Deltaproteobacteria bacterium]MBW2345401.1 NAD(P)-dependent oxidoreductase [Deltaproteobacteria bacterium]
MKDKVVVIGGSGFLGSHLADALLEEGYAVTVFDVIPSPWLKSEQEMVVGDFQDETKLGRCLKGTRYVYHLAGIADIGEASMSPRATIEHNIMGSAIVLDNCVQAGVERLLFASTVYVYSQQGSFYRVSKQAAELLIEAYFERFNLEYTILRYGSLYGPRAQAWNGLKRYVTQAVKEGRIDYPGSGLERREYIHVQDAAGLSVAALDSEYANKCLTLTGTQILNSKELLHMIKEILGGEVEVNLQPEKRDPIHYEMTPYRFTPRVAHKMVPNVFVDIGQGILDLVEEVYQQENGKTRKS